MKFLVYKILIFMAMTFALCILVSCKGKEYTYQERKWQSTCLNSSEKMAVADFTMQCSAGTVHAGIIQTCADTAVKIICPMVLVCRETKCTGWLSDVGFKHSCNSSPWVPCPLETTK